MNNCPNCGHPLLAAFNTIKCPSCNYEYELTLVQPPQPSNNYCAVCGNPNETQLCPDCKSKMMSIWAILKEDTTNA